MYFGKYGIERAFPGGSVLKNPPAVVGDACLILGLGRSPGEGNDTSRKWYSCLGNPMDRGAWQARVPWRCKRAATTLETKQQQHGIDNDSHSVRTIITLG